MAPVRNLSVLSMRQRGFGLVEIMVGVTIGLLALLVVYQVLGLSEGYRRTTMAGNDAQSSGMISSFIVAGDLATAGHTIAEAQSDLATCPAAATFDDFVAQWRPIPVLIEDGGGDAVSDRFALFGGNNKRLVSALETNSTYTPGGTFDVQSPLGFHASAAGESAHRFVLADIGAGRCESGIVSPWPAPLDALTGMTTVTPATPFVNTYPQGQSWLVNLGPFDRVRKLRYDVDTGVLRRTDLLGGGAPNPVVSNVALMKAQYGIDTNGDQFIDEWVSARNAPWRPVDVLAAPIAQLRQIKAVRIALVVRSAQFERQRDAEGRESVGAAELVGNFTKTLFPCNAAPGCTGEMANVEIPGTANYRYRVFEQVIPLTNQIWNPS